LLFFAAVGAPTLQRFLQHAKSNLVARSAEPAKDLKERQCPDRWRRLGNRRSLIARLAETLLQKTPLQINRTFEQREVFRARYFHGPKLKEMRREPLGVEQDKALSLQLFDQRSERDF
jgi:hypothetical protein